MRLDVAFTPTGLGGAEVQGRTVFVVDILRATTTICAALHHGARAVIPAASTEEALRLGQTLDSDDVLLAGERNTERIPGFALGNSPLEMTPEAVRGKLLVLSTTNGTGALLAAQGAATVYLAAAVNIGRAGERARQIYRGGGDLVVMCAGREGGFGLDDAYCAGRLVEAAIGDKKEIAGLNDAALASLDLVRRYGERWERPLRLSAAGQDLTAAGFKADIVEAAKPDAYPVLPQFADRRVTAEAATS
jgi:2-phosphosulfolactate phosphatase